ncbi:PDR/VanB family oxidoreductase [Nocardia arizonensis]|uniref:PDR/VanB family oxidoreductase n=1 Tax=Nocardia arizonensis TaxID=1141647 RepID=UPI0006D0F5CF|nr:PDR/VanB family oxidoreductase [Nocardia arizonensis]
MSTTDIGLPPPSIGGRFRQDPFLRAFGGLASMCEALLDNTDSLQRFVNRRPRQLPLIPNRIAVVVRERRIVAEDNDVVELTLAVAEGDSLPGWHPGAHVDVYLPSGRKRQYSLCGDPRDPTRYRIAVRRSPAGGGGSIEAHELTVGTGIEISNPRNAFALALPATDRRRLRFLVGGIGITPILPMIRQADEYGLDWSMLYLGRHRRCLPYLDELAVHRDRVTVRTDDRHGLPTTADLLAGVDEHTAVYACGPRAMIDAVRTGLPAGSTTELHYEQFSPPPVVDGRAFELVLARGNRSITVAAGESALEAIRRHLPDIAYSCRQGFCGTCEQRVLDGEVDHREKLLSDVEHQQGRMLVCVSRAAGDRITLDL